MSAPEPLDLAAIRTRVLDAIRSMPLGYRPEDVAREIEHDSTIFTAPEPLRVEYGLMWDDLGSADTFPTLDQARAMAASFQQQAQVVRIETWPVADEGAER
jgi:hypothetical protein